ncbi:MAG TPA: energy transducer TonB [Candidatus Angelobacter sp.]|nr:energy transducer TonB [Candidatus Angelobacter sp.]
MAHRTTQAEEKKLDSLRHARPRWMRSIAHLCLLVVFALFSYSTLAQTTTRKLKNRVEPQYPDLARRNNITGSVRLELLIATDGKVKDIKVLGGNPVLVQAAVTAVTKWKYEPSSEESTIIAKVDFNL